MGLSLILPVAPHEHAKCFGASDKGRVRALPILRRELEHSRHEALVDHTKEVDRILELVRDFQPKASSEPDAELTGGPVAIEFAERGVGFGRRVVAGKHGTLVLGRRPAIGSLDGDKSVMDGAAGDLNLDDVADLQIIDGERCGSRRFLVLVGPSEPLTPITWVSAADAAPANARVAPTMMLAVGSGIDNVLIGLLLTWRFDAIALPARDPRPR